MNQLPPQQPPTQQQPVVQPTQPPTQQQPVVQPTQPPAQQPPAVEPPVTAPPVVTPDEPKVEQANSIDWGSAASYGLQALLVSLGITGPASLAYLLVRRLGSRVVARRDRPRADAPENKQIMSLATTMEQPTTPVKKEVQSNAGESFQPRAVVPPERNVDEAVDVLRSSLAEGRNPVLDATIGFHSEYWWTEQLENNTQFAEAAADLKQSVLRSCDTTAPLSFTSQQGK